MRSKLRLGRPAEFRPPQSKGKGGRIVARQREDGLIQQREAGLRLGQPELILDSAKFRSCVKRPETRNASVENGIFAGLRIRELPRVQCFYVRQPARSHSIGTARYPGRHLRQSPTGTFSAVFGIFGARD
jgi:hypothetical protein